MIFVTDTRNRPIFILIVKTKYSCRLKLCFHSLEKHSFCTMQFITRTHANSCNFSLG